MDRLPHLLTQRASLLNLLIIWTALFSHAFASCYTGDGNLDTSSTPCPGSNMCCYLNRSDGYADDVCIQGACYSNYWTGEYFVIGCTSQNWDEEGSGCSPLWDACGRPSGYTHVSRCPDSSFCCGKKNTTCCGDYSGIYLNEEGTKMLATSGEIEDTTSSYAPYSTLVPTSLQTRIATSTGTSTTSSPSNTATATTPPPEEEKPKEGLTAEAKIGMGVGIPTAVFALLALWRQYRPRPRS